MPASYQYPLVSMRIPPLDPETSPLPASQTAQFNALVTKLSPEHAAWLLGYLQASQRAQQPSEVPAPPAGDGEGGVTILFASQTGNAEKVAKQLAAAATMRGLRAVAVSVADYKVSDLRGERNLILVSSTQGEGDPPDAAAEFHRVLLSKHAPPLHELRFAVLALGDYSYANFCRAGQDFDRRLEELGGRRVLERVDCDVEYEATAEAWQGRVLEAFADLAHAPAAISQPTVTTEAEAQVIWDKSRPFAAPVLARVNLNGRGSAKKTVHVELSLTGSGITYQPGDAVGILPCNSPAYLAELLATATLPADAPVVVDGKEAPLAQLLGETFEVTTITRPFVKAFAAQSKWPDLAALLEPGQEAKFQDYARGREIIDVLQAYPPRDLSPQAFVGMLRRLQPRLYSIASSLLAHEEEVHLLVGLTRHQSHGRQREGVCSGYVCERLGEDEPLRVFPSPNPNFKLPQNPDARIIMIGPGTGVAPFRAFVEEREALGCRGRNWLFFGDQHFDTDFLYQVEWQRWYKSGVLSHLDLAFSRDQPEKIYVQHRMIERGRDLYAWLQDGAQVYVCGSAGGMAADVQAALLSIIAKESGKSREAAEEYFHALQASKRYQRDVY
jgi:sulfite reductase (NADPH) flavoprotein alpha-component